MRRTHYLWIALVAILAPAFAACESAPEPATETADEQSIEPDVRQPDMLDHQNFAFGDPVPQWVREDVSDLEQLDEYEDLYLFKFEGPRAQSLMGAQAWVDQFVAANQIASSIQQRIESRFTGALVGDVDMVETYMEQVVDTFTEANVTGYIKLRDYWVQRRYYTPDGEVDEDAYSYYVLYGMDRDVLDAQIERALQEADSEDVTEEEASARDRVRQAIENGL